MKPDSIFEAVLAGATESYRAGMAQGEAHTGAYRAALRSIVSAYNIALADPETKIPTRLHIALEMARRWC